MRRLIDALDRPVWLFAADGALRAASPAARLLAPELGLIAASGGADAGAMTIRADAGAMTLRADTGAAEMRATPAPDAGDAATAVAVAAALRDGVAAMLRGARAFPLSVEVPAAALSGADDAPSDDADADADAAPCDDDASDDAPSNDAAAPGALRLVGDIAWIDPLDREAGMIAQLSPAADRRAPVDLPTLEAQLHAARAEAEEARRSLARFRHMADNAPGAVYERIDTPDGRWVYTYHSAGMPDLFGVTAEEVAQNGRAVFNHIAKEEVREIAAKVAIVRQTGEQIELVMNVAHPTRGMRAVMLTTQPYNQPDGSTIWFGNMADISAQIAAERRAAEAAEALRASHERLNRLADNAPGALWEYRVEEEGPGVFGYFSASLPEMVGVDAEVLRSDALRVMQNVPEEETARVRAAFAEARRTGETFLCDFPLLHPRLGERRMLLSAHPAPLGDGVTGWFANLLDITHQAQTEAKAKKALAELQVLHQRLSSLTGAAPAALYEFRVDEAGRSDFPFFTPRMPEMLGLSAEEIAADGDAVFAAVHPEDLPAVHAESERSARTMEQFSQSFRTLARPGRPERWLTATAQPVLQENGSIRWFGFMFDATARIEAERRAAEAAAALRRANERFITMADNAPGAIFEFRLTPEGRLKFLFVSPRLPDLLGVSLERILAQGDSVYTNIPAQDRSAVIAAVTAAMTEGRADAFRSRILHPARGERWVMVSLSADGRDEDGVIGFGSAIDVTEDMQRETELRRAHELAEEMRRENERQALHDGLTGLPNRRCYDREAERRRAAGGAAAAIVRIDLDYFKSVNDTLGHEAGDAVLQRVAEVLESCLGPGDFAARIGGDEFSILPEPGRDLAGICTLVEAIRARIAEPFFFEGRQCRFGASFGIARSEDMAADAADLPVFADAALYRAKEGGRNRLEIFTPELRRSILADRRLAVELHEALERDEFEPWFQPQFSARDESLVGVETLLRWRRADGRVMTPDGFMHVAEQLRIVPEIDRIMMLKAGGALDRWRAAGVMVPKISFNVSAGRMHDPDVVELGARIASGPTRVTFELLESILVEEESDAFRFHLDKIREAGIEIEIDDFGSGHASIIGLMQIAPKALKIDKRIVLPVARDDRARHLVRAIVEIADTLGIATVAEGVETAEQVAILREMGCDVLQGFHYARALDEDRLAEAARGWRIRAA